MDWKKPSLEEGRRPEDALRGIPCRCRPMFGCPAWFADGLPPETERLRKRPAVRRGSEG